MIVQPNNGSTWSPMEQSVGANAVNCGKAQRVTSVLIRSQAIDTAVLLSIEGSEARFVRSGNRQIHERRASYYGTIVKKRYYNTLEVVTYQEDEMVRYPREILGVSLNGWRNKLVNKAKQPFWPPAGRLAGKLAVNCLETVTSNVDGNQQPSYGKRLGTVEGSEVRDLTNARNKSPHERRASHVDEDMTRFSGKPEGEFKRLSISFGRQTLSRSLGPSRSAKLTRGRVFN